jgi:hypothetical protein
MTFHRCSLVSPRPNESSPLCSGNGANRESAVGLRSIWVGRAYGGKAGQTNIARIGGAAAHRAQIDVIPQDLGVVGRTQAT